MTDLNLHITFEKTDYHWTATCDGFTVHITHNYMFFDAATLCMEFKKTYKFYTSSNAYKLLNIPAKHTTQYNIKYLPHLALWLSPTIYIKAMAIA